MRLGIRFSHGERCESQEKAQMFQKNGPLMFTRVFATSSPHLYCEKDPEIDACQLDLVRLLYSGRFPRS